jgi:hypothetical protein
MVAAFTPVIISETVHSDCTVLVLPNAQGSILRRVARARAAAPACDWIAAQRAG